MSNQTPTPVLHPEEKQSLETKLAAARAIAADSYLRDSVRDAARNEASEIEAELSPIPGHTPLPDILRISEKLLCSLHAVERGFVENTNALQDAHEASMAVRSSLPALLAERDEKDRERIILENSHQVWRASALDNIRQVDAVRKERDELKAEVERLKDECRCHCGCLLECDTCGNYIHTKRNEAESVASLEVYKELVAARAQLQQMAEALEGAELWFSDWEEDNTDKHSKHASGPIRTALAAYREAQK